MSTRATDKADYSRRGKERRGGDALAARCELETCERVKGVRRLLVHALEPVGAVRCERSQPSHRFGVLERYRIERVWAQERERRQMGWREGAHIILGSAVPTAGSAKVDMGGIARAAPRGLAAGLRLRAHYTDAGTSRHQQAASRMHRQGKMPQYPSCLLYR